jgi:hypothetical protein
VIRTSGDTVRDDKENKFALRIDPKRENSKETQKLMRRNFTCDLLISEYYCKMGNCKAHSSSFFDPSQTHDTQTMKEENTARSETETEPRRILS